MINSFKGKYFFLSNFYPCEVFLDGVIYPSAECAFQAQKTLDENERMKFITLTPSQAKRLGRRVVLRDDWEEIKIDVMRDVLLSKFGLDDSLGDKLLSTEDEELVEANNWRDMFWGVYRGVGENYLGKLLMELREFIREERNES